MEYLESLLQGMLHNGIELIFLKLLHQMNWLSTINMCHNIAINGPTVGREQSKIVKPCLWTKLILKTADCSETELVLTALQYDKTRLNDPAKQDRKNRSIFMFCTGNIMNASNFYTQYLSTDEIRRIPEKPTWTHHTHQLEFIHSQTKQA